MWSNVDARQFRAKTKIARNCLTCMLDFIAMQMSRVNREKGYWSDPKRKLLVLWKTLIGWVKKFDCMCRRYLKGFIFPIRCKYPSLLKRVQSIEWILNLTGREERFCYLFLYISPNLSSENTFSIYELIKKHLWSSFLCCSGGGLCCRLSAFKIPTCM